MGGHENAAVQKKNKYKCFLSHKVSFLASQDAVTTFRQ